jgi:hypothetical protein
MRMKGVRDAGFQIIARESGAHSRNVEICLLEIAAQFGEHSPEIFLGLGMMDELRL